MAEGLLDSNLVCPCSTSRANIVKVVFRKVSRDELLSHRQAILDRVGMTYEELAALAVRRALVGDQWSVWDDVQEIDFLLDTCRNTC